MHLLVQQKKSLTATALANAKHYKAELEQHQYQFFTESYFNQQAVESLRKQQVIEESDTESFDQFLDQYFSH